MLSVCKYAATCYVGTAMVENAEYYKSYSMSKRDNNKQTNKKEQCLNVCNIPEQILYKTKLKCKFNYFYFNF
jgi:hypothetical protein